MGRKKKIILFGGVFVAIVAALAVFLYFRDTKTSKDKKATPQLAQTEAQAKATKAVFADLSSIIKAYDTKKYAEVVSLTRTFDTNPSAKEYERQQAFSLCLDSAIQIKDDSGKEFCYTKAKALAQVNPDERTKTELTKRLDEVYNGTYKAGTTNDGKSQ